MTDKEKLLNLFNELEIPYNESKYTDHYEQTWEIVKLKGIGCYCMFRFYGDENYKGVYKDYECTE